MSFLLWILFFLFAISYNPIIALVSTLRASAHQVCSQYIISYASACFSTVIHFILDLINKFRYYRTLLLWVDINAYLCHKLAHKS
jgi:hypothetical protein